MKRRTFIKSACISCTGSLGAVLLFESCNSQKYINNATVKDKKIVINKSEFTIVKKNNSIQKKFIITKVDYLQFPIVIYKINENDYKALYMQCTHQGCELTPYEAMMVCPCHGAEFNTKGEVITGPAEINLKSFITSSDNENIYIQL